MSKRVYIKWGSKRYSCSGFKSGEHDGEDEAHFTKLAIVITKSMYDCQGVLTVGYQAYYDPFNFEKQYSDIWDCPQGAINSLNDELHNLYRRLNGRADGIKFVLNKER